VPGSDAIVEKRSDAAVLPTFPWIASLRSQ
jgi:hypothetical protein